MALTLPAARVRPWVTHRSVLWTTLAGATAVLVGAVYPTTASVIGPIALPVNIVALVVLVISAKQPGLGVAVAFVATSLTPGLVGPGAWVPGLVWIAALFSLMVLRPANQTDFGISRLPPLAMPALVFAATVLVAFAASPAPELGLPILRSSLTGILLLLLSASALRSTDDIKVAIRGISGAALLVGGFACLQRVVGASTGIGFITSTGSLVQRVTAGFGHPNLLGGFLVVLVPLAATAAFVDRRWRVLHVVGLVLALGGIYASFSRGALLAVILIPFVLIRGRWLLLLVPVAALMLLVAVPSVMTERFALAGNEGAEVAGRRDIWATAGAIWLEHPALGTGLGGFPGAYTGARVVGKQFLPDTRFEPPPHAHNLGLQLLTEQGVLGFVAFGWVFGLGAWGAARLRRSTHRVHALLGAGVLASLAGMFVHNLFDVTMVENAGVQLWGVLGILSALMTVDRSEETIDAI